MIEVKQAKSHKVNFYGLHIPKGAVYAILPPQKSPKGQKSKLYVWVTDFEAVIHRDRFPVYTLSVNDTRPRKVYVDGSKGYARLLKEYICAMPAEMRTISPTILKREIGVLDIPRDREVGNYIQRPQLGYHTNPYIITDYDCREMKVY